MREVLTEVLPGHGEFEIQLARTPIVALASVLSDGVAVTDYALENRDEGTIYRRAGWGWSGQSAPGLTAWQRWPGRGESRLPGSEESVFSFAYTGGYIAPSEDAVRRTTISVQAADASFNDSGNGFPALLLASDVIESSGFSAPANNGRFLVNGTPTPGKITVAAALVDEGAGSARTVRFRNRADVRPFGAVEKACIEAVKTWWLDRKANDRVVEKQVGQLRIRRDDAIGVGGEPQGLPPICMGLLRPWMRAA